MIASATTRILVDAGLSCRELLRRMAVAGEDRRQLSAILITHEHQDHVAGLAVLARRLQDSGVLYRADPPGVGADADSANDDDVCEWLDHVQRRERKRGAQAVAGEATAGGAGWRRSLSVSAEAATLEPSLNRRGGSGCELPVGRRRACETGGDSRGGEG